MQPLTYYSKPIKPQSWSKITNQAYYYYYYSRLTLSVQACMIKQTKRLVVAGGLFFKRAPNLRLQSRLPVSFMWHWVTVHTCLGWNCIPSRAQLNSPVPSDWQVDPMAVHPNESALTRAVKAARFCAPICLRSYSVYATCVLLLIPCRCGGCDRHLQQVNRLEAGWKKSKARQIRAQGYSLNKLLMRRHEEKANMHHQEREMQSKSVFKMAFYCLNVGD